jgi:LPS sulfotransferase NodH
MTIGTESGRGSKPYDLTMAECDYPPWSGPPRRTIVVCTHQRSGSTLFGEAMYFAGGLGCPLEYYHAGFRPALAQRWQASNIGDYAAAVGRYRTDPGGTLSIKLFWRDVVELAIEIDAARFGALKNNPPDATEPATYRAIADILAPLLHAPVFVHLFRRDRIRQAISTVVASDTGQWRRIPDVDEREPAGESLFDLDRIEQLIGYSDFCHGHWRNFFAAVGAAPYVLTYEDLARDYVAAAKGALRFLDSDMSPPSTRMRRQADEISESNVLRFLRARAARAQGAS